MEGEVRVFDLSLTARLLFTNPDRGEWNAATPQPPCDTFPYFREQLSVRIMTRTCANPVNNEMGIQRLAH